MNRSLAIVGTAILLVAGLFGLTRNDRAPIVRAQGSGPCALDLQFIIDVSFSMLGGFDMTTVMHDNGHEVKSAAADYFVEQTYYDLQTYNHPLDRQWFMYYRASPPDWYQIFDVSPPGQTIPEGYGNGPPLNHASTANHAGAGKPLASAINLAKNKLSDPALRADRPNNKRIVIIINDAPTNMDLSGTIQSRRVYNIANVAAVGMKNANGTFKTAAEVRTLGPIDPVTGRRVGEPLADSMVAADALAGVADKINSISLNDQGTHGFPEPFPYLQSHPSADLTEYLAKAGGGAKAGVFQVANTFDDLRALTDLIGQQRLELCGPAPTPTPTGTPGGGTFDPDWRLTLKKFIYDQNGQPTTTLVNKKDNMKPLFDEIKSKNNLYPSRGQFYPDRAAVSTRPFCDEYGIPPDNNRYLCLKTMVRLFLDLDLGGGPVLTTHLLNHVEINQVPSTGQVTIEGNVAAAGLIDGLTLDPNAIAVGGTITSGVSFNPIRDYLQLGRKVSLLDWAVVKPKLKQVFNTLSRKGTIVELANANVNIWNLNSNGNPAQIGTTSYSLNPPTGKTWVFDGDLTFGELVTFSGSGTIVVNGTVSFKEGFACSTATRLAIIAKEAINFAYQPAVTPGCGAFVSLDGDISFPKVIGAELTTMSGIFIGNNINLPQSISPAGRLNILQDKLYLREPTIPEILSASFGSSP